MTIPARPWATEITSNRPIAFDSEAPGDHPPPGTFLDILQDVLRNHPDRVQYVLPDGTEYTVRRFYDLSAAVAKALLSLGLSPCDPVCILGPNCVEWFAADVGACLAAVVPVGIYTTNTPEVVAYILNHCKARVLFVDGGQPPLVEKALSVLSQCPNVKKLVCWGAEGSALPSSSNNVEIEEEDRVMSWQAFLQLGTDVSDGDLEARSAIPQPSSVCKLIYTSGTTGPPKAVMLSHDNLFFTIDYVRKTIQPAPTDRMVSFLPASHIAANLTDICCVIAGGVRVTFASANALRDGSLGDTLRRVRPTILTAVPRVYEKIMEKMLEVGAQAGALKSMIAAWAKGVGTAAAQARESGLADYRPWGYTLAERLVFSKVKMALGLDQCRLLMNTAAPMQEATDRYFKSLDFQIFDMYGMSETTGPLTFNYPDYRAGTSGKVMPGVELKMEKASIDTTPEDGNEESQSNEDDGGVEEGELCFRGRNVFVGYMGDEDGTRATVDADGFIHSGDVGRVDRDGFVTISGRVKELLVTAGGENIAPVLVESSLLTAMPALARAFAIGDGKKFVSAVLIPYADEHGRLTGPAATVSAAATTAAEAKTDEAWRKYMEEGVARANERAVSAAAMVKKFELVEKDFSVETGELTPTMKVRRKVVVRKLEGVIEKMYSV